MQDAKASLKLLTDRWHSATHPNYGSLRVDGARLYMSVHDDPLPSHGELVAAVSELARLEAELTEINKGLQRFA